MAKQILETELPDGEVVTSEAVNILDIQTRGEIDVQIATAKKYPRSIKAFKQAALEMATLDEDTASQCIYALPRDGKSIQGPSARLAEIVLSAWGNSRAGARTISDDGNFIIAQGAFHDLERNVAINFEVRRRITNKKGQRYNDDMVSTTANAACSIALRNAVFKGIPKAFWSSIYEAAKKTAIGDATTLANRRAAMLDYFQKMGGTQQKIFDLLEVKGADDIGLDHLATLKGLATAIKEGDVTVDEAFAPKKHDTAGPPTSPVDLRHKTEPPAVTTSASASGPLVVTPPLKAVPHGSECAVEWPIIKDLLGSQEKLVDQCRIDAGFEALSVSEMSATQLAVVIERVREAIKSAPKAKGGMFGEQSGPYGAAK